MTCPPPPRMQALARLREVAKVGEQHGEFPPLAPESQSSADRSTSSAGAKRAKGRAGEPAPGRSCSRRRRGRAVGSRPEHRRPAPRSPAGPRPAGPEAPGAAYRSPRASRPGLQRPRCQGFQRALLAHLGQQAAGAVLDGSRLVPDGFPGPAHQPALQIGHRGRAQRGQECLRVLGGETFPGQAVGGFLLAEPGAQLPGDDRQDQQPAASGQQRRVEPAVGELASQAAMGLRPAAAMVRAQGPSLRNPAGGGTRRALNLRPRKRPRILPTGCPAAAPALRRGAAPGRC